MKNQLQKIAREAYKKLDGHQDKTTSHALPSSLNGSKYLKYQCRCGKLFGLEQNRVSLAKCLKCNRVLPDQKMRNIIRDVIFERDD